MGKKTPQNPQGSPCIPPEVVHTDLDALSWDTGMRDGGLGGGEGREETEAWDLRTGKRPPQAEPKAGFKCLRALWPGNHRSHRIGSTKRILREGDT